MKHILVLCSILMVLSTSVLAQSGEEVTSAAKALEVKENVLKIILSRADADLNDAKSDFVFTGSEMEAFVWRVRQFQEEKAEADTTISMLYGSMYRTTTEIDPEYVRIADTYEHPFIVHRDYDGSIRTMLSGRFGEDVDIEGSFQVSNLMLILILFSAAFGFLVAGIASGNTEDFASGFVAFLILMMINTAVFFSNGGW